MALEVKDVVQVLMQQRDRLFAYLWTIIGDAQLAEDTFQELSLLAVEKATEVQDVTLLAVWLRRTARLKALETLRGRNRLPLALDTSLLDRLDAHLARHDTLEELDVANALHDCIGELTANNQQILTLRYAEDKKTGDIAKLLGRKVTTVYQAIGRIHSFLRQCVEAKLAESNAHE